MIVWYSFLIHNLFCWLWRNSCENCAPSQYHYAYIVTIDYICLLTDSCDLTFMIYMWTHLCCFLSIHSEIHHLTYLISVCHLHTSAPMLIDMIRICHLQRNDRFFLCCAVHKADFFCGWDAQQHIFPSQPLKHTWFCHMYEIYYLYLIYTIILKTWKLVITDRSYMLTRPWKHKIGTIIKESKNH